MAGAGFKTFASGEVLTAANVNTYLMQQTVMVFADSSARSTALGANVSEGMLSYLKDTNKVEVYDGSSWVASDDPNAIQNTIVDAKGDLISATAADTPARLASSGVNGDVLTVDTSTATGLKWSAPASGSTTWTLRKNAHGSDILTIAYNGSNLYVAAGSAGNLFSSSDGLTWTSRTSGFGANAINRVIFANSLWVAVGDAGIITTSSDGITWTARTANMSTNNIRSVAFGNGYFVAVGGGGGATNTGGVTYSTDGLTWTRKSMTPSVGTTYFAVNYNGTNWNVGTQSSGSNNSLTIATDPTGTWTAVASGSGESTTSIFWDGTRLIAGSSGGLYYKAGNDLSSSTIYQNLFPAATSNGNSTQLIYNSKLHQLAKAYVIANTAVTVAGFAHGLEGTPVLAPGATAKLDQDLQRALFVGAAGIIIADSSGSIHTSF